MGQKNKTFLRTFRISENIYHILEKDSKEKCMNLNASVSSILTRYAEWDRYAERFGVIMLPLETFKLLLDEIEQGTLEKIGENTGGRFHKEFILFHFKRLDIESFLHFFPSIPISINL